MSFIPIKETILDESGVNSIPDLLCDVITFDKFPSDCVQNRSRNRLNTVAKCYIIFHQIESEKGRESNLKQLKKRLNQQQRQAEAERELKQLMKQDFACAADAFQAAHQLAQNWKEHTLDAVEVETHCYYCPDS